MLRVDVWESCGFMSARSATGIITHWCALKALSLLLVIMHRQGLVADLGPAHGLGRFLEAKLGPSH